MNSLAYFLILLGAILRILPHPGNFAPIAAIALFGGVYLSKKHALWLPLLAMFLSDIFIGFDSLGSRLIVYGSFLLVGLIGLWIRENKSVGRVAGGTLLGSLVFYLITNFAYLYPPTMYSHDLNGVVASYINALPFFRNSLFGDLFYVGVLFGAYELVVFYKTKRASRGVEMEIHG